MTLSELPKLPVGKQAKGLFDWMSDHLSPLFDAVSACLGWLVEAVLRGLTAPPGWRDAGGDIAYLYPEAAHPFVMVAVFVALTWGLQRDWKSCLIVAAGFLFILNQRYWEATAESLSLILVAGVLCMGIGVPIGIAAAHRPKLSRALTPILDLMQTLPTFVYLIPAIVFFGLGMVPGLIATVVFVLPASIRATRLGVETTPPALMEAATAFGATPFQRLRKVELPSAWPQIMAGLNQTIMLSLSMVVISALVGASGLGVPVVRALNTVNAALGFESGLVIVALAISLDRMLKVRLK